MKPKKSKPKSPIGLNIVKRGRGKKATYHLAWDSIVDEDSWVHKRESGFYDATIRTEESNERIRQLTSNDLRYIFEAIDCEMDEELNLALQLQDWEFNVAFRKHWRQPAQSIRVKFQPDFEHWAATYSLVEFADKLEEIVRELGDRKVRYGTEERESPINGFWVQFPLEKDTDLGSQFSLRFAQARNLIQAAQERLVADAASRSLSSVFRFPPQIKTACEQYLIYFGQFLADLGIEAQTQISEEVDAVLFKVTPKDGTSALANIRDALDAYLRLADTTDWESFSPSRGDLALQQLQSNVLHLQSQLTLAKATMQMQQATIQHLQLSQYQIQPPADSESVVGDSVSVTPYEGPGFKINLPGIVRKLKRLFRR